MAVSRERKAELRSEGRAAGRDIGPIPAPANKRRRARCRRDLLAFARTYFPARFPLAFSDDHLRVIQLLQVAILTGGQFAVAMPRGSGKTTICEVAVLWALLFGHRRFVFVVAADSAAALSICASLRAELESNEALLADFPDACFPIAVLKGIARRAEGQTSEGERTCLIWTKDEVRLPKSATGGGSVIRAAGITGRIRGAKATMADGAQARPDLVLVDDPQTDESARSPSQVAARLKTMTSTILGLAGPGQRIACLTTVTVIERGDLADQILDRQAHPEWQGFKAQLMRSMPTAVHLWDAYAEILREDMRLERGGERATSFYREHREAMDAGADPAWPQRVGPGELSATQHAMNLRIVRGEPAFLAEYQNAPADPLASCADLVQITAAAVLRKINHHDRGVVPVEDTILTAGIDVQGAALYWSLVAWSPGFAGDLIAYGTYPDQGRPYFRLSEIEKTIAKAHPGGTQEAAIYAALEALVGKLCGAEWMRDDGTTARVEQVLIDAGWFKSTDAIYQFARRSTFGSLVLPYFGRAVAAGATPLDEWRKKPGDRSGPAWRIPKPGPRQARHVLADPNVWKSFLADRLLAGAGGAGSLGIYGSSPAEHRMLADQLAAEVRTRVSANGRTADEWRAKPNQDNHLLDTLVMSAVGASIRGAKLDPRALVAPPRPAAAPSQQQGAEQTAPARPAARPSLPAMPAAGGWMDGFTAGGDGGGWQ